MANGSAAHCRCQPSNYSAELRILHSRPDDLSLFDNNHQLIENSNCDSKVLNSDVAVTLSMSKELKGVCNLSEKRLFGSFINRSDCCLIELLVLLIRLLFLFCLGW